MSRFVEGEDRRQPTLLPSCLDDYVGEDNPARVIDAFVDELDLGGLGFAVAPGRRGGRRIIRRRCSSSTSTATSIVCRRAADSSVRRSVMSS
jgi:hypothetical protein